LQIWAAPAIAKIPEEGLRPAVAPLSWPKLTQAFSCLQIWAAPAIAKIPEEGLRPAVAQADAGFLLFADLGCACDRKNP